MLELVYGKKFNISRCTDQYSIDTSQKYLFYKGHISSISNQNTRTVLTISNNTDYIEVSLFEELDLNKHDYVFIAVTPKQVNDRVYLNPVGIYKVDIKSMYDWQFQRVELQIRSQYSQMAGISSVEEIYDYAYMYNFSNIVITDLYNVHAIPKVYKEAKRNKFKPVYAATLNVYPDKSGIIINPVQGYLKDFVYTVYDIETTSLMYTGNIIEIGAVKYKNGIEIDKFHELIYSDISETTTDITGITQSDLIGKRSEHDVLIDFYKFIQGTVLVGHNINFDYNFLNAKLKCIGLELNNMCIDTLKLSRLLIKSNSYTLDKLAKKLKLSEFDHHRAYEDAKTTCELFKKLLVLLNNKGIHTVQSLIDIDINTPQTARGYNINVYVKNRVGLKNLYKLISISHLDYFYRIPKLPYSVLNQYKDGLIITNNFGSYCDILDDVMLDKQPDLDKYDYILIGPSDTLDLPLTDDEKSILVKKMYDTVKDKKSVIYVSNAYYIAEYQKVAYQALSEFNKTTHTTNNHLLLQDELLDKVTELTTNDTELVHILHTNTFEFMMQIEDIVPLDGNLKYPVILDSDKQLKELTYNGLHSIYGDIKDEYILNRIEEELSMIIKHGYSVLYLISKMVIDDSEQHGYHVGSRGSVGSSLVAYLCGISEVNPLPAHYYCKDCGYIEYSDCKDGYDLPEKQCSCGKLMLRDGHDIPFQTFLGFNGEKCPDIDVNISGEYQDKSHKFVVDTFGKDNVFRAGTILTIKDKTANSIAAMYIKQHNTKKELFNVIKENVIGVKRSTGAHAGGLILIPKDNEVYDFTPIQYPANKESDICTTHFEFIDLHNDLVKLDALGHDSMTQIKYLEELTGINQNDIDLTDKNPLKVFQGYENFGINSNWFPINRATAGIPEFNTPFLKQMLEEIDPKTFSDLNKICSASHGTDVWLNNIRDVVLSGTATMDEVPCSRDDIMNQLISYGIDKQVSFNIMERVRKGKSITEEQETMLQDKVPSWYISILKHIKYMFPKSHAISYLIHSYRMAWYKYYYPLEFYATVLSTKSDGFSIDLAFTDLNSLKKELFKLYNDYGLDKKDKDRMMIIELVLEMRLRGYEFKQVDINRSHYKDFVIDDGKLLIPLNKVDRIGEIAAKKIWELSNKHKIEYEFELSKVANKTVIQNLKKLGITLKSDTVKNTLF